MNPRLHIAEDDLALYAAGALTAEETANAEAHLKECARCAEEVRQNTLALSAYAQTTPEAAPPEGAKSRFMARLAETSQGESAVPARQALPVEEPKPGFWRASSAVKPKTTCPTWNVSHAYPRLLRRVDRITPGTQALAPRGQSLRGHWPTSSEVCL